MLTTKLLQSSEMLQLYDNMPKGIIIKFNISLALRHYFKIILSVLRTFLKACKNIVDISVKNGTYKLDLHGQFFSLLLDKKN